MLERTILRKFLAHRAGKSDNVGRFKVFELTPTYSLSGQSFSSTKNIRRHLEKTCPRSAN